MGLLHSPCRDCKDRRMGCHNEAACTQWAAYLKRMEAQNASVRRERQTEQMMDAYNKDRLRKARKRGRGRHAE